MIHSRVSALLLMVSLFSSLPARAGFEFSGYAKNLFHGGRSQIGGAPYEGNLSRLRLSGEGSTPLPGNASCESACLRARVDYDHELRLGSVLRSKDFQRFGLAEPPEYLTMEQAISSGTGAHYRHRLYRGWVEASAAGVSARLGRQRVAWGTGKLWNPTDFLNPYLPTVLERDERRGVDALYLRKGLGALGQGEAVYVLADTWAQSDLVGRLRGNAHGTDMSLLAGKVGPSTSSFAVGGDFAMDLYVGSLHGEGLYADLKWRTAFWKWLIGYEYDFGPDPPIRAFKDLWAVFELHRNGAGVTQASRYNPAVLLSGREVSLARDYAGLGLRKELHPLLKAEVYALFNLNDGSKFIAPSLDWNALKDLHLSGGWQRFGGNKASEFGRQGNVAFLQAQYFF